MISALCRIPPGVSVYGGSTVGVEPSPISAANGSRVRSRVRGATTTVVTDRSSCGTDSTRCSPGVPGTMLKTAWVESAACRAKYSMPFVFSFSVFPTSRSAIGTPAGLQVVSSTG